VKTKKPERCQKPFPIKTISIADLVPGERTLVRSRIDRIKALLSQGIKVEEPRVNKIDNHYYVRDGNHRIMARKELGEERVRCRIQPLKTQRNVADFDTDTYRLAIEDGCLGFENIPIGTKESQQQGYDNEDEDLDLDLK